MASGIPCRVGSELARIYTLSRFQVWHGNLPPKQKGETMKLHDVQQGSVEWLNLRAGLPTASDFDALVSPLGKVRTGEGVKSFLAKKVAEAWQGGPLLEFNTW